MNNPDREKMLQLVRYYEQGNILKAEELTRNFISLFPENAFGWKILATVLSETEKLREALIASEKAIYLAPGDHETYNGQGHIYAKIGDFHTAINSFEKAIALHPTYCEANYNLANALYKIGKITEAETSYRKAIESEFDFAPAHNNLGLLLQKLERFDEAESCFIDSINLKPDYVEAHLNLGVTLKSEERYSDAIECYERAITLNPNYAEAYCNLGNLQRKLGILSDAKRNHIKAIELKPTYFEAYCNLGGTLKDLGNYEGAKANYQKSLELNKNHEETHYNLAVLLQEQNELDRAEIHYRLCLTLSPSDTKAHCNLGVTLQELGRLAEAEAEYRAALAIDRNFNIARSNLLFLLAAFYEDAGNNLAEARDYGNVVDDFVTYQFSHEWSKSQRRLLTVGFASADFKSHPVGFFFEGLLHALSEYNLELIAYYNESSEDNVTKRLKRRFTKWRAIKSLEDSEAAELIYNDKVDILVDLSGHTAKTRLPVFAWKPAPVQITWLGFFSTTGLDAIDYILGDRFVTPKSSADAFSEKIYQLPDCYLCFTPPTYGLEVTPLPALEAGQITFGCFNKLSKLNDNVLRVWGEILAKIPHSRLFLKDKRLSNIACREALVESFKSFGVAENRLILEGSSPRSDYLQAYNKVDIALSPFPYGGGTTSVEGLWMGVPFVTKKGNTFISSIGESIACNTGLSDWVSESEEDYIDKAVRFASNLSDLSTLRSSLRDQALRSPVFNAKKFSKDFVLALETLWNRRDT